MEELGWKPLGQVSEHHDLFHPHYKSCHSQKPMLQASLKPNEPICLLVDKSTQGQKNASPGTGSIVARGSVAQRLRAPCWYH